MEMNNKVSENKAKNNRPEKPIERQNTAAWANIEEMEPVSNVSIPSEMQAINAKEYVDENQK